MHLTNNTILLRGFFCCCCSVLNLFFFPPFLPILCTAALRVEFLSLMHLCMKYKQWVNKSGCKIFCLTAFGKSCLTVSIRPVTSRAYSTGTRDKVSFNHIHQVGVILEMTVFLAGFKAILVLWTTPPTLVFTF